MELPFTSAAPPRVFAAAPAVREQLRLLKTGAPGARQLLIRGEAGSGRSFWAALYHRLCGEPGPLVTADCALLSADLFEAQLFGVARGAATGVAPQPGLVGRASGGLLVLDRLELLDFSLQAKLLRLLDSGEYTPLGGAPARTELRVAAILTAAAGDASLLRPDLFYRLSGLSVQLPPLRERPADLTPFVHEFLRRAGRPPQSIKPAVLMALKNHPLPGNLRELEALLTGALGRAGRRRIDLKHLPATYSAPWPAPPPPQSPGGMLAAAPLATLETIEREHVLRVLAALGGNRSAAARTLGISRKSLWERLARWGLGDGGGGSAPEAEADHGLPS
jgi:transcriptional regulator with PAS, ATPase and Fis domain